jgi:hypothetical protein
MVVILNSTVGDVRGREASPSKYVQGATYVQQKRSRALRLPPFHFGLTLRRPSENARPMAITGSGKSRYHHCIFGRSCELELAWVCYEPTLCGT